MRRERRLGRRRPALGGARRQAPVLGRAAAADGRRRSRPARRRSQPERPDLPKRLLGAVDARARARPGQAAAGARRSPSELRSALGGAAGARRRVSRASRGSDLGRSAPSRPPVAGVAALAGGDGCCRSIRPAGRSALARGAPRSPRSAAPRAGLALALAAPVLPLGNSRSGSRPLRRARRSAGSRSPGAMPRCGLALPRRAAARRRRRCSRSSRSSSAGCASAARRAAQARRRGRCRSGRRRAARACRCRSARAIAPPLDLAGVESAATVAARRSSTPSRPASRSRRSRSPRSPSRCRTPRDAVAARRSRRGDARGHAAGRSGGPGARRSCSPSGSRCGGLALTVRALDSCSGGMTPRPHERPPQHRAEDRRPLRGRLRPCLPHARAAGRARAQAREGDGRAPHVSVSRVYVPNEYSVYLPADREQFAGYEGSLVGELQDYLAEHARRESYALLTPPKVLMQTDDDLASASSGSRRGWCSRRASAAPQLDEPDAAGRARHDDDLQGRSRRSRPRRSRRPSSGSSAEIVTLTIERHARTRSTSAQRRARPLEGLRRPGRRRERLAPPRRAAPGGRRLVARRPRLDERHRAQRASACSARSSRDGDTITLGATELVFGRARSDAARRIDGRRGAPRPQDRASSSCSTSSSGASSAAPAGTCGRRRRRA